MLVGGGGIDPSGQPPVWWLGLDSGGGAYPIGPNGPYPDGFYDGLSVVTRATSLIVGPLTSAPFRVQELGFGGQPLGRPRWVTDPCLLREDARIPVSTFAQAGKLSRGNFWSTWLRHAIFSGTGAFVSQEDEQGQPLAGSLRIVEPSLLSTARAEDGSLRWVLDTKDPDRVVFGRDGRVRFGPVTYRLTVLRNPHFETDAEGHTPGVFEAHAGVFSLGEQITSFESGTFRSGIPAGYLKVDSSMNSMTPEQAAELKANWMAAHGGDRRSIAVLNSFTSFTPLNLSPVDAALGEAKRLNIGDVAFAFGLDPLILGVSLGNSATYSSRVDAFLAHRDYSLAPWIAAVEDTLSALLPGTQGVKVDLDRFANPPLSERVTTGATAVQAGLMTVDEWRELEGLPPHPEPVLVEPAPVPVSAPTLEPVPPPEQQQRVRPQPWRRSTP